MKCTGVVKISGDEYVVMIVYQKSVTYFYLLSKYHREDQTQLIFGGELQHPIRTYLSYSTLPVDNNYIVAVIAKKNIGGGMKCYGMHSLLLDFIDALQRAVSYTFRQQDILRDDNSQFGENLEPIREFMARDEEVHVSYRKVGGFVGTLVYKSRDIEINFRPEAAYKYPNIREIKPILTDLKEEDAGTKVFHSNIKTVDYPAVLRSMSDHSWYVEISEDGSETYHKDYKEITNKEDLEREVVMGIVNGIKDARGTGKPLLLSVDTETTGLDVYGIPTEFQSKIVAIPLSFKDDTGFVIFTAMEYFDNIPMEYVKERLEPFFKRDLLEDPEITIQTMEGPFTFKRSEIFLVGQNTMFDIKAFLVHDVKVWFDADTMQMSFNLDPFLTKRRNSLKYMTRKLRKCHTPTLSDVLGEGNEDKFKYITDVRVARLYGGSDGDFSRLVYKDLRHIYEECKEFHRTDLYKAYLDQDVIPMNMIATFDYDGFRVDREHFVSAGEKTQNDIKIITDFAHAYVGRMVAASNYLRMREMVICANVEIDSSIALLKEEHKHDIRAITDRLAELESQKRDPDKIKPPDLSQVPPYVFKLSGNDLIKVMYDVLCYPILVWTSPPTPTDGKKAAEPRPAINKVAMQKLMGVKSKGDGGYLTTDILDSTGKPLILAKEFNSYKYPLAYLVSLIGPRKKEYDSYFAPFVNDSFGNRLAKSSRFASIDTRRIANPVQVVKGSLKKYIFPHDDTYAMCDFDMSQVELRIMASLAHDVYTIEKMKDPEVDSHTECASDMSIGVSKFHKAAYLITKSERSYAKQVNFGYPYGLQRASMCERIFGDKTSEHLAQTQRIIEAFESARHIVVSFLNKVRKQALMPTGTCKEEPIPIPEVLRKYLEIGDDIPVGIVRNLKGFYKLFQLDNMSERKSGRIQRQVGNYPIQSFAAELFRMVLIRLFKEFWRLGWIQNKYIRGHLLIHDEFLFSFKKDAIHPVHLAAVLQKSCTVRIKDHTIYYIGMNIGNSWGDCKDDNSELPVHCVERLVKRWESGEFEGEVVDDPKAYMDKLRQEYISDRIYEVVSKACPGISKEKVDCPAVLKRFENYTVRKYVYECFDPLWTPQRGSDGKVGEEAAFDTRFASWALDRFGDGTRFITSEEKEVVLHSNLKELVRQEGNRSIPYTFGEMFEGEVIDVKGFMELEELGVDTVAVGDNSYYRELNWDLDNGNPYFIDYDSVNSIEDEETFEEVFNVDAGDTVETMRRVQATVFSNIHFAGERAVVKVFRKKQISQIETMLKNEKLTRNQGVQIFYTYSLAPIKGSCVSKDSLERVDEIITNIKG